MPILGRPDHNYRSVLLYHHSILQLKHISRIYKAGTKYQELRIMCHTFSYFWSECTHITRGHVRCENYPECHHWLGHATVMLHTDCPTCTVDPTALGPPYDPLLIWRHTSEAHEQIHAERQPPLPGIAAIPFRGVVASNIPENEQRTPLHIRRLRELETEYSLQLTLAGSRTYLQTERLVRAQHMVQRHIHMLHDVNAPRVTINPNYSHRIEELIEMVLGFPDHRELNIALPRVGDDVDQEELIELLGGDYAMVYAPGGPPPPAARAPAQPSILVMEPVARGDVPVDDRECPICQDDITDPDASEAPVRLQPCRHIFGEECINRWFDAEQKDTCPVCRHKYRRP